MNLPTVKSFIDAIEDYLPTKEEIEFIHRAVMADQGSLPLYINESHLDAALGNIQNTLHYQEDKSISHIALLYAERVAQAHAFQDGNKRAGYAAMQIFFAKCSKGLDMSDHEQANFMVDLVNRTRSKEDLEHELHINLYDL